MKETLRTWEAPQNIDELLDRLVRGSYTTSVVELQGLCVAAHAYIAVYRSVLEKIQAGVVDASDTVH